MSKRTLTFRRSGRRLLILATAGEIAQSWRNRRIQTIVRGVYWFRLDES